MAQQQGSQKQAQDPYVRRGKTLASSLQRLRGWVGSDPSREPELADALVQLTEHRLLGHGYAAAAADAQEAVRRAAALLTSQGPIGPYTVVSDAVRYITAVVHLATIQAGLALPEAAGRTIESVQELRQQLEGLRVEEQLSPRTVIWALSGAARGALASGDVALANAYADAVLARLAESGLRAEAEVGYVAVDADRLAADCRWAAGRTEEALSFLHRARSEYDEVVHGRLREPGRLSPAVLERLAEPLFGLYRDLADRLTTSGEVDLGLVTRRSLVELLQGLLGRLGDVARLQLASALADLAGDLLAAERPEEAAAAAADAVAHVRDWPSAGPARWLVAAVHAEALTRLGRSGEGVVLLRQVVPGKADNSAPAAQVVALMALAEALRADADPDAGASVELTVGQLVRDLLGSEVDAASARSVAWDLARGVVSRGTRPVSWAPLDAVNSYAATTASGAGTGSLATSHLGADPHSQSAAWLEAERAEAHRLELERLDQARIEAERRDAERVEAERAAAEQLQAERAQAERAQKAARREAEERAAAGEAERFQRKLRREERLEAHRLEVEQREAAQREAERVEAERLEAERTTRAESVEPGGLDTQAGEPEPEFSEIEPDELAVAQQAWSDAKSRGDRRAARVANERVVELLRPRAQAELHLYGAQLQAALEDLSSARLRSGDVWGSRAPAKEAKALAKALR